MLEVISITGTRMGIFPRQFVEQHNLLHRAVGLLVCNEQGEVYVHRRADTKSVHPSYYDMFVGGLVVAGEGLETAARCDAPYPPYCSKLGAQLTQWLNRNGYKRTAYTAVHSTESRGRRLA